MSYLARTLPNRQSSATPLEEEKLMRVLIEHQGALEWTISD